MQTSGPGRGRFADTFKKAYDEAKTDNQRKAAILDFAHDCGSNTALVVRMKANPTQTFFTNKLEVPGDVGVVRLFQSSTEEEAPFADALARGASPVAMGYLFVFQHTGLRVTGGPGRPGLFLRGRRRKNSRGKGWGIIIGTAVWKTTNRDERQSDAENRMGQ